MLRLPERKFLALMVAVSLLSSLPVCSRNRPENNVRNERYADYEKFYSDNATSEERLAVLRKYNLTYVLFGDREKAAGNFSIDGLTFLEKIYDNGSAVYKFSGI